MHFLIFLKLSHAFSNFHMLSQTFTCFFKLSQIKILTNSLSLQQILPCCTIYKPASHSQNYLRKIFYFLKLSHPFPNFLKFKSLLTFSDFYKFYSAVPFSNQQIFLKIILEKYYTFSNFLILSQTFSNLNLY